MIHLDTGIRTVPRCVSSRREPSGDWRHRTRSQRLYAGRLLALARFLGVARVHHGALVADLRGCWKEVGRLQVPPVVEKLEGRRVVLRGFDGVVAVSLCPPSLRRGAFFIGADGFGRLSEPVVLPSCLRMGRFGAFGRPRNVGF